MVIRYTYQYHTYIHNTIYIYDQDWDLLDIQVRDHLEGRGLWSCSLHRWSYSLCRWSCCSCLKPQAFCLTTWSGYPASSPMCTALWYGCPALRAWSPAPWTRSQAPWTWSPAQWTWSPPPWALRCCSILFRSRRHRQCVLYLTGLCGLMSWVGRRRIWMGGQDNLQCCPPSCVDHSWSDTGYPLSM